ncbi:MAG: hypothetical protein MI746_13255 [Pseudomonadales bacterium]|nr:hypothetical protein [Pseudomonadales bacterium]
MRVLFLLVALLASACTSSTVIRSSDPESRIYVNGEYMGTGEAFYSDEKVAFSRNKVEIRKDGCQSEYHSFRRNEEADVGAIVGGIFLTVPFLWVTEYKPYHSYEFQCQNNAAGSD